MPRVRVLIADDRPVERDYYRTVLGYVGYEVLEAADGAEALELIRRARPDLVLTDVMMPTLDGYALMRAIRADAEVSATRVIFCTANYHTEEARQLADAVGAARFLLKPVEPQALLAAVEDVLGHEIVVRPELPLADVEQAHLRLLNDQLYAKMAELEAEIAARRQVEETLRRRNEELEALMDAMPAIVLVSQDAACLSIVGNRAANELFGVEQGTNVSHSTAPQNLLPKVYDADGRECGADDLPMQRAVREGRPILDTENFMHFPGGRKAWLLGNSVPLHDDAGKVRGVVGAFADITRQKMVEATLRDEQDRLEALVAERTAHLMAANRELRNFSSAASHDLRAPLGRINSFSSLLARNYGNRLDADGLQCLEFIRQNAERMTTLIDDLLDHAQAEKWNGKLQPVRVKDAVQDILQERDEDIQRSGTALQTDLPEAVVLANPLGLAQVLRNLLENALKYAAQAAPPVIHIGGRVEAGHYRLWVRDNGIGFDMVYHDQIFEIFRRLHTYEEYPGSGVGLALVRKAMEDMGGRVWAESAPGRGATFFVELPLQ